MADTQVKAQRPDIDIEAEIDHLMTRYPPMVNDRRHVTYTVKDGVVTLRGHLKSGVTRHYLADVLPQVKGVRSVHMDELYQDADLRRDAGALVPYGVFVNVEYGVVILTGRITDDTDAKDLIAQIEAVPGVRQVSAQLKSQ